MKKIAVKRDDGTVAIIIPTLESTPELMERDAKAVPGYVSHREIDDEHIPEDRTFRNAWTDDLDTPTIDVHIPKAHDIYRDRLRYLRKPRLAELDIQFMKAIEKNESVTEISAKKQELRDITKIDLPNTVEELLNFLPDALKDES